MESPDLTLVERRILLNQFKIMAALDVDDDRSAYARLATVVEDGYELEYSTLFESLIEPVSHEACRFVRDVLEMYSQMQQAYDFAEDRHDVDETAVLLPGFDGNDSNGHLAYARFLRATGRWERVRLRRPDDLNSHGAGDGFYPEMLSRFRELHRQYELSMEDVRVVVGK